MRGLGVLVGAGVLCAALWLAAEQHYRGCVASAEARYPVVADSSGDGGRFTNSGGFFDDDPLDIAPDAALRNRRKALAACSRLPF